MARPALTTRLADALTLIITGSTTVRCLYPKCRVQVRYRNVMPSEAKRLTELALGHDRH
ncbi:hypothetical protein ACFRKD_26925 [Streptomyces niveus]|uniref:hypothetical protein n=1 Tax=Streptomyces niveus TaxID=193462 RepID=UPI0036C594FB